MLVDPSSICGNVMPIKREGEGGGRGQCTIRGMNLNCRYIAVTQPIKYAKHKNNRRVWLTILLVWAISAAIGSPIVLGLNNTPDRTPDQCLFYNTDFIIYSSLSSFYIPCIIMVFLYYNIFKVRTFLLARFECGERERKRKRICSFGIEQRFSIRFQFFNDFFL